MNTAQKTTNHSSIENDQMEKPELTAEQLQLQIQFFNHVKHCANSRKARIENLMQRRSANGWISRKGVRKAGWDQAKKTCMIRRLMRANEELEQANDSLERLMARLDLVKDKESHKQVNNVAPFISTPATSV